MQSHVVLCQSKGEWPENLEAVSSSPISKIVTFGKPVGVGSLAVKSVGPVT